MNLELQNLKISGYHAILNTNITHEETMEAIVPDACPDILRIVETEGTVCMKGKDTFAGRAEFSGTATVTVLYCPEGEESLRRLEVHIPFRCGLDAPELTQESRYIVRPWVRAADTRILNPRKVLVRVDLLLCIRAFGPSEECYCTGFAEGAGIQQLEETHRASVITSVKEKPFTFSEDLAFPSGSPAAEELLRHRVALSCNEAKVIGNKLILKGEAILRLSYRSTAGALCGCRWALPFSQIMEIPGVEEEADCTVTPILTGCSVELAMDTNGEARSVAVTLDVTAQAVVREERTVKLISDAYSTESPLEITYAHGGLTHCGEEKLREVSLRETLEVPQAVRAIEDCSVTLVQSEFTAAAETGTFAAESAVTVLYRGEDNALYSVTRRLPAGFDISVSAGERCNHRCRCSEAQAVPTVGGIEVRYSLLFSYQMIAKEQITVVTGAEPGEVVAREGEQPSLILRVMQGERLWDLAKGYRTTVAEIMAVNALEQPEAPTGTLLLIPQKR
ncbi:MAG: DUF3794 domain-containing protein [Oscillospiraceae bacterium]